MMTSYDVSRAATRRRLSWAGRGCGRGSRGGWRLGSGPAPPPPRPPPPPPVTRCHMR